MPLSAADRLAILGLAARYCHALDRRDPAAIAETFTEDGVLDSVWTGRLEGRAAIAAYFGQPGPPARHWVNSPVIEGDGDHASLRLYLLSMGVAQAPPRLIITGTYDDRLRKVDGTWLFTQRTIVFDGPVPR